MGPTVSTFVYFGEEVYGQSFAAVAYDSCSHLQTLSALYQVISGPGEAYINGVGIT